jgi:hypothetical protein
VGTVEPITVTVEQIQKRDFWIQKLMAGQCTLNEALYMCMASGAPFTPYLIQEYERAFMAYQYGEKKDLAEAFGYPITGRDRQNQRNHTRALAIFEAIAGNTTLARLPPDIDDAQKSVFAHVGKKFNLSSSRVEEIFYEIRGRLEQYDQKFLKSQS